jgi:hypothetical protein
MYILFEEHQYESHLVEEVLKDIYVLQDVDKKVSVQYVGYFYNPHLHDCVFILPKVLLTEQETLVGMELPSGETVSPEQVLTPKGQEKLSKEYRKFIYEFSVWIYRALSVFYKANPSTKAILYKHLPQAGRGARHRANTYLDIVLSLIDFNKENRDFVLFTIKNLHRGNNKINWTRTISHTQAFVQDADVVYTNPVNKKRIVNYEEELFVIFYSILNYLNEEYGFHTPINIQYDLICGKQFRQYMNGMGKTRLMQIKYKYFSDKALQLWDLCYAFFENTYRIAINTRAQEYILAKSFNVVFEAMIDELIGTPHSNIPKGLADQPDGKRVDHLYTYDGLTISNDQQDQIYYIGDSKYYKAGNKLGNESIYKQFTYARNVIQWNIDLFVNGRKDNWRTVEEFEEDKKKYAGIRLRDDEADPLTEGYNIIPNFFISAFVDEQKRYNDGKNIRVVTEKVEGKEVHKTYVSNQFKNRLFDRDTLILSHYNVNFLYVIYLYARNRQNEKAVWKQEVRRIFRDEIRQVLADKYDFYAMKCKGNPLAGEEFIKEHFKELQGKLYRPYGDKNLYSLALEKQKNKDTKDSETYHLLEELFEITKVDLGVNPKQDLEEKVEAYQAEHPYTPTPTDWLPDYHVERYLDNYFVVGMYHDQEHWDWITGKNDKSSLIYNVRLDPDRPGSMTQYSIRKKRPLFAILYEKDHEKENKYHVFRIHDYAVMSEERMRKALYPREPKGDYFIFRFDDEVSIGRFDIGKYIADKSLDPDYEDGIPLYPKGEELLKYRL